jgi:hypothetical protein
MVAGQDSKGVTRKLQATWVDWEVYASAYVRYKGETTRPVPFTSGKGTPETDAGNRYYLAAVQHWTSNHGYNPSDLQTQKALEFLKEFTGVNDAAACIHGSMSGCGWAAMATVPLPPGKLAKLAKLARGINAAERATLNRMIAIFPEEELREINLPDGDFIGKSGKFDAMGAPGAFADWERQRARFKDQMFRHAHKSDYGVVDKTGASAGQIEEVMTHYRTLDGKTQQRLIVINGTDILN